MYGYAIRTATWPRTEAASDLRAAIEYLRTLPEVDPHKIIAVEVSGGGFATVALPPTLSRADCRDQLCRRRTCITEIRCLRKQPVRSFSCLRQQVYVPMLWIYSENDLTFGPEFAQKFYADSLMERRKARFHKSTPFGDNRHNLFEGEHEIPFWTAYIDDFSSRQESPTACYALPLLHLRPPRLHCNLSQSCRQFKIIF